MDEWTVFRLTVGALDDLASKYVSAASQLGDRRHHRVGVAIDLDVVPSLATLPSASMRYVVRTMPMKDRP